MGLFDQIKALAGKLDRDKEKSGFQLIPGGWEGGVERVKQSAPYLGTQIGQNVRKVFSTPVPSFAQKPATSFTNFSRNLTASPLGAPGRFTMGLGQGIAQSAQRSADLGRQANLAAAQNRSAGMNRLRAAFQPNVLKPTGFGYFQGAKTLAQVNPIGGMRAIPGAALAAGLQGGMGAAQGQDFATSAGRGFAEGLGYRTVTNFTDPIIGKAVSGIGGGFLAQQLGQRGVGGIGNVIEDEILSRLEGQDIQTQDRVFSFVMGAVISGNDNLMKRLKKDLTTSGIKPKQADEIVKSAERIRDQRGRYAKEGQELVRAPEKLFEPAGAGEPYKPSDMTLQPRTDGTGLELQPSAKSRLKAMLADESGFVRLGPEPKLEEPTTGKLKVGDESLSSKTRIPEIDTKVKTIEEPSVLKSPADDFVESLGKPEQTQAKTPLQEANLKQSTVPESKSLEDIVARGDIDVKQKVGVLDYLRTPDRVLKKIGLGDEAKFLRTQYNKYLRELPQEINKITEWSKRVSPDSSQRIFQYLDGQKVDLTPEETKVTKEIQSYLKEWADKLNLPEEKRITNYITHIFEKDFIQKEFDPELAKILRDQIPGSVYDPFTQKRLGKQGYVEDAWRALDAYVKRGVRKVNMDPALEKLKKSSKNLEESQFDYVKNYLDRVNMRPTKIDNLLDNTVKQLVGYKFGQRPVSAITGKARNWVYRGTLGLNPGSALKNLSQGVNTYAKLGEKYTIKGYADLLKNGTEELKAVGVLDDGLVQDRNFSATKKFAEKFDQTLFSFFDLAEKINRGSAYYGAKAKALADGLSEKEAIEKGLEMVRDTQFTFGKVDTPVALQSDLSKVISQFQSFSLKQGEFLGEMIKNKEFAGMLRYVGGNLLVLSTIGQAIGMDWKDMIPSLRFGLPPTLAAPVEIGKAILGTPDKYGQERDTQQKLEDVGKTLLPFIPAGTQARKTIQGAQLVNKGYSATKTDRARFLAPKGPLGKAQAVIFGQYNTPEGRAYVESGFKTLSAKQTEELKARLKSPEKARLYFDTTMKAKEEDKKTEITNEIGNMTYEELKRKYPEQARFYAAEKIYKDVNNLDKDDVEGKRAITAKYKEMGYTDQEVVNAINKIKELEEAGMAISDRQMLLFSPEVRARKILDRFNGISSKSRKQELLQLYKEYGILTPEVERLIVELSI